MSEAPTADNQSFLQRPRGIVSVAVALIVVVVVGLLIPLPLVGRAAHALGDLVHAPLFAGLTVAMLHLLDRFRPIRAWGGAAAIRVVLVFFGFFFFGIAIEVLQQQFGRTAAISDVAANGLGILAGTLWFWSRNLQRFQPHRRMLPRILLLSTGFALAIAWWSPLATLRDVAAMYWNFPLLASFESRTELQRWEFNRCQGSLTRQDATEGDYALEISYQKWSHPAASLYRMQADWSAMKTLELDAKLDASYSGDHVELMVKVVDQLHADGHADTYRKRWTLKPGEGQRITIGRDELINGPDTRAIDLSQIKFLHLLLLDPLEPTKVRVDRIRLTLR